MDILIGRKGEGGGEYNPLTRRVSRLPERIVIAVLFMASSLAVLVSAAILYTLIEGTCSFFAHPDVDALDFFFGSQWLPTSHKDPRFGILPLLNGTLLIAGGTILLAGPIGIGAALYLSEFAGIKVRAIMKPVIELLAGIPSIVYGFFAIIVISPILQDHLDADYFNAASAIVVMTFMVLPIVVSISDDAMKAVPRHMREASLAMGATRWETSLKVVVPAASSGIAASLMLGLARAIGETMVVALAAGQKANVGLNPLQSVLTMTGFIASVATGDIPPGTAAVEGAFAVGLYLFVLTFIINRIARRIVLRIKNGGRARRSISKFNLIGRLLKERNRRKIARMIREKERRDKARKENRHSYFDEERQMRRLRWRHIIGKLGVGMTMSSLVLAVIFLMILLVRTFLQGYSGITWNFLTGVPGWRPEDASIYPALVGSVSLMVLTMIMAVPVGIGTAVYFNEIAPDTRYTRFLRNLIQNLAGVPSIVFGLVGLAIFVRMFEFGPSLLAGSLTLALMVLPIIVVSSEEALRSVPISFREAARGMGATRWQTVRHHVLPNAVPGIITGSILALSRAIGETAPILFIGGMFSKAVPNELSDSFVALPLLIFNWSTDANQDFVEVAASTILVLLGILLAMNAVAIFIRYRSQARRRW